MTLPWKSWRKVMKELEFVDFYDVGLGGDMTAVTKLKNGLKLTKKNEKSNLLLPCICKYGSPALPTAC